MKLSGSLNQCPFCGEHFAGPVALAAHFQNGQDASECATPQAMAAAGMQTNRFGFWLAPVHRIGAP